MTCLRSNIHFIFLDNLVSLHKVLAEVEVQCLSPQFVPSHQLLLSGPGHPIDGALSPKLLGELLLDVKHEVGSYLQVPYSNMMP